jgi:hypothetical protein
MCYAAIPSVTKITKAKTVEEIEELANQLAPGIAQVVTAALQALSDGMDLDALADALEKGDEQAVLGMLDVLLAQQTAKEQAKLQDAAWAGGALAAAQINPVLRGATFEFNRLNPKLVDWLQTYSLELIREVNDKTVEGVRSALTAGMKAGQNPRTQATQIKQIVGLTNRQSAAVANFRKELEGFHERGGAAGYKLGSKIDRVNGHQVHNYGPGGKPKDGIRERRLRDFRYDKTLSAAMASGKPLTPAQIDKMVEAYARKYRKYRGDTIARTESMRTLNIGVQDAWRQAIESGKVPEIAVRRFWKVASDERTCPVCKPIPDLNPKGVAFAQPFATPKGAMLLGPVHPDCRCHTFIRMVEPQEYAYYGIKIAA